MHGPNESIPGAANVLEENFTLNDTQSGEPRVQVSGYFARGRSSDLLVGQTLTPPFVKCVIKVPTCDRADATAIQSRLERVETEYDAMQAVSPWVAMPVGLYAIDVPVEDLETTFHVPVIAWRHFEGETLKQRVARHPSGVPLEEALTIAARVAGALHAIHEHGFVMRSLSPDHVLVDDALEVRIVGFGCAWPRQHRIEPDHDYFDDRYSAPELAGELSGRFVLPKADLYSFGAVLSFLVTGEHPTGSMESPLTRRAHEKLSELPEGLGLIIAHCMQPIGKKRFGSIARVEPLLTLETLPTGRTQDFAEIALVAPFGRRAVDTARVGHLSAGPLVNRPAEPAPFAAQAVTAVGVPAQRDSDEQTAPPRLVQIAGVVMSVVALLILVALIAARTIGV